MINILLVTHLVAASIWVGGHLILSLSILPKVLATNDVAGLLAFEQRYEKIGMPALILQVITGVWMAYRLLPSVSAWFVPNNDISQLICLKLSILATTILIALHARFRVIPNLSAQTLPFFAVHIVLVTLLSVGFVIVGSLFRTGF